MYATIDKQQRFYGKDKNYFISYAIDIKPKRYYTVTGTYSYAVLDMYGETLKSGYCDGTTEVYTNDKRSRYITISGFVSSLDTIMILDVPKSEAGDNPSYIPHDGGNIPSGGYLITSFLANNFNYDSESNSYKITSYSPNVESFDKLGEEFTVYVHEADHINANSSIDLFGNRFEIYHITNQPLTTTMESVASVMPFLCSKSTMTARMLYSYISTSQTGLGLEDLFLDVENEPFK